MIFDDLGIFGHLSRNPCIIIDDEYDLIICVTPIGMTDRNYL